MATHNLKSRIMQKSDTEANWKKATNFAPLDGEIIVYEVDDDNLKPRIKIGNGSDYVNDLPFINDILIINATDSLPEENAFSKIQTAWQRKQMVILRENLDGIVLFALLVTCLTDQALFIVNSGTFSYGFTISSNNEMTVETATFFTSQEIENRLTTINNSIDAKADASALTGLASQSYVNTQISKIDFPVDSVNGKTGAVTLSAADLSAYTKTQTNEKIATDIDTHNTSTTAHDDIRSLITNLNDHVNAILNSTDTDLDQLSEIVNYIKSNRELIDAINSNKIAVTDIIDNLTSTEVAKPLSANQGRELKALIDKKVETSVYNQKVTDLESSIGQKLNTTNFTQYQSTNDAAIEEINSTLSEKANASDVEAQLAEKADQTTVDTKLDKTAETASRVMISDGDKNITTSSITTTKLGYLTDVTSNIQTQINAKASTDSVTTVENKVDNLKNFSKITVGSTNIEPDSNADTLTFSAGSGIILTGDATNDKITITANIDSALSSTSTNPVQNKAIHSALAGKLDCISGSPEGHLAYVNDSGQLESSEVTEETLVTAFSGYGTNSGSIQNQLDNKASKDTATTSANGLMSSTDKTKLNNTNIAYGTCSTDAATAEKVVTISGNTQWTLTTGSMITVKFTATNTAANPTLNVNSTGAYPIYYNASEYTSSSSYGGYANRHITYQFNGTHWVFISWSYDSNSDTKVQQNAAITTAGEYPVILAYSTATTKVTNAVQKTSTLKYNPSTKILTAPTFKGDLDGTAAKATADASGNNIVDTYATKSALDTLENDVTAIKKIVDISVDNPADETINTISEIIGYIEDNEDAISIITNKQDKITGAATTITSSDLTPSHVLVSDSSGKVAASSSITTTELDCLSGLTGSIQVQLQNLADGKVDKDGSKVLSDVNFSAAYETRLNGIAAGAEVNQNAFSNIAVGSTTIAADTKTDTLTLTAGTGITLTPDAAADKITIAVDADSELSDTSTKPVQNKIINTHFGNVTNTIEIIQNTLNEKADQEALDTTNNTVATKQDKTVDTANVVLVSDNNKNISTSDISTTQLGYLAGVESNIQTQLNGKASTTALNNLESSFDTNLTNGLAAKQDTITGAATTIASSNLTASRALISNSSGKIAVSAVTSTELGYLDGVTSNIQTQFTNVNTELTNLEDTKVTSANAITAEQIMALCEANVYSATGRSF